MMIRPTVFNLYLLVGALSLTNGCKTAQEREQAKEASTLRLYLETNPDGTPYTRTISVFRAAPVAIGISTSPFLDEGNISQAAVVEPPGEGVSISLQFDRHGTLVLDNVTTADRGRRIVVFSQFGKTPEDSRWLAAPLITHTIGNGVFTFTPDATAKEAERIVQGLNNVAKKLHH